MKKSILIIVLLTVIASIGIAAERPALDNKNDKINYSVGHQVGRDLVRQEVEVNPDILLQGILDAVQGTEPLMSFDKMIMALAELKEKIVQKAEQKNQDVRRRGIEFLKENEARAGVVTLPSGLQYKVLRPGSGKAPVSGDLVKVNYISRDVFNNIFDSTYVDGVSTPVEFMVDNVIPGWVEGLKLMQEGAKWELYVPFSLAFKDASPLAGQTVIFEIELLQVKANN